MLLSHGAFVHVIDDQWSEVSEDPCGPAGWLRSYNYHCRGTYYNHNNLISQSVYNFTANCSRNVTHDGIPTEARIPIYETTYRGTALVLDHKTCQHDK